MKNGLSNLTAGTTYQLAAAMRNQLNRIQRRPALITGFLAPTRLTLELEPSDTQTPAFQALYSAILRERTRNSRKWTTGKQDSESPDYRCTFGCSAW